MSVLLSILGRFSALLRPREHAPGMQHAKYSGVASWALTHSRYIRVIAWINIVFQLLFPVTLAFTPAIVAAKQADLSEQMSALQGGLGERPESAPVFVTPDETAPSSLLSPSSAPSSLSPSSLTPSSLSPSSASAPVRAIDLPDLGSSSADKATQGRDEAESASVRQAREQQEKLDNRMNAAQQLWGVLGGPSLRDQGLERATGIASGLANQAAEDWLKQYGNARLSFSTQGIGSLDLLAPLWESNANLFYTQLGGRRDSDRTTTNVGLGWRSFTSDWMLGVNAFYDYDMTGENKRAGVGIEAWRDYLKLSANSYLRLTDWHQSVLSEMQDYDERPANGFDVRAEAYLPAYPQLGGKLMYEQYQGKGVSLTGSTSDLQDNPSAVTVGLNYTPVPLIKVGVEHKNGSGVSDTALTLDFSYRFGTPWIEQINPESVAFTRSLAGSRYDLVDRNNSIVMQYRKQDLISLLLNVMGTPYAGERVIVTANVTSKYGLDHMVWDAPALLAAGGKLTPQSVNTVEVLMPAITTAVPMRARAAASDRYELGGIAYDTHGNASPRATVSLVSVRSPQDIGSLSITKDKSVANGVDENTVQITTVDTQSGSGLANAEVELTFTHAKGAVLSTQTVTTDTQGQAVVNLASTLAGVVTVKALLKSNNNAASTTMSFVADSSTAHIAEGSLTVVRDNALADGNSTNAVKAVVTDAQGNPVSGIAVDLSATNGAVLSVAQATTNDNGEVAATLKSLRAGISTVTATVNGQSVQVNTTFLAGKPQASTSSFSATPTTIVADGRASSALQLTLNDGNGNSVNLAAGQVSLQVGGVSGTTLSALSGQDGVYTASLVGIKAGEAVITPRVEGSDLSGLAQRVTLTADGSSAQLPDGALTVTQNNAVADDTATNKVQAVVTDANGNPVSGVPVVFSATAPAHITVSDYATDANGIATATLASPTQGSVAVSAEANGSRRQVNVTFAALRLVVKATDITGKLEVGQSLEGQYTFSTNGSDKTDNSTFAWSNGGQSNITTQTYGLSNSDVGKVLTFSVTAKNGAGITGNTDSISTKDAPGTGGSGSGDNPGEVIDPTIAPAAKDLDISGKLEVGQTLTGSYTFVANGGDTTDKSTLAWSNGGQSGMTTKAYSLNTSDIGKILTFTVTPKNGKAIVGTAVSINTKDAAGVSGGDSNNPGGIVDPNAKPSVKVTDITGTLEVGQTLEGQYTFNANGADGRDASTFAWRNGGQSNVTTKTYSLNTRDIGKILTFSVTAKNGAGITGNTDSISTKDAAGTGGSGSGENPGEVIDPSAKPIAQNLNISGKLESGATLTGSYTFNPNGGDTSDKSTYLWTDGGQSGITATAYTLNGSDVGKILTFTVTPINGKAVQGTPVSINTRDATGTGGSGSGENPGEVIDPTIAPAAKDLDISGKLEVGQTLTGRYTFVANGGDTTDKSTLAWSNGGQSGVTTKAYSLNTSDIGKILTFTVTPKNGKAIVGTAVSINTKDAAGVSGGDGNNPGGIIDPNVKPIAQNLNITGTLEVGQTLTGSYTFNPNGGDTTDASTFSWNGAGTPSTQTTYGIASGDVGQVLTFTITPINGKAVQGNPVSISTKDAPGTGGSGSGENPGEIIDPNAKPIAQNLNISGKLESGATLTGSYTFNPNGGDTSDKSTLLWTDGGQSGITATAYTLNGSDVGKILTFTVTPINGKAVQGTPVSINTRDATGTGGSGSGQNPGEVIDPTVKPSAKDLNISGLLEVGQTLTGRYTFSPNGGDTTNRSTVKWDGAGTPNTNLTYAITTGDTGKILTFTVTPINGKAVHGDDVSINTKDAAGVSGGDGNHPGEIINPGAVPVAENLDISGKLEVGQTLTGSYTFNPNGGDTTDKSTLAWSNGGQSGITTKTYGLNSSDVGKILTFTVTPINGKAVQGTPVSINTTDATGTTGGDGGNKGEIIDPTTTPIVTVTNITGKLEVGSSLTGAYTFDANKGDSRDASTFAWSDGGQSGITTTSYSLNASDIGKVLTFSVTAKNGAGVTGNTDSLSTQDAAGVTDGDTNNPGAVVDPTATPSASNLNITGKLEVGQTLTGSYTFNPNGGDTTDASTFNWNGAGTPSTQTTYGIVSGDVGHILTFTVTPINGKAKQGTPVSINTTDATGTTGGDGGNKGEIIDPTTTPIVTVTNITGKLEVGSSLTGAYTFDANKGDSRDASTFAWSDGGQSGITTKSYSLNASDIGKVLTFSVTAVNGAGVTGNTDSLSTKDAGGVTDGDTNNPGAVVDPTATPSASNLNITGKLEVGQTLTGSYTFNPNGGDTTDASTFNWNGAGTPSTQTTYGIVSGDVGHILTFTVTPINGKAKQGTPVSISTQDATGVTGGDGDLGHKGEIIDPAAKPSVTADDITGKLEVGQTLTGHYTFTPNGGDSRDASTFAWTDGGQSGVTATTYSLNASDVGKVLTFSVTAVNGAGVTGNTDSISTKDAGGTTGGDTDNKGEIIDPAVPSTKHSLLSANPLSITADGTSSSTLTFEAKNAGNEAITGLGTKVSFASAGITAVISGVTESAGGVYTATLTGTQAGTAIVSVSVDGTAVSVLPVQITLTAGAIDTAHSDLTATPDSIVANNGLTTAGQSVVTLTLKDVQDNPVTGLTDVVLNVAGVTHTTLTAVTESPAGSGIYTATLSGTTSGTATLTASAGGAALNGLQTQVTLTPDITTATVTTVTETTGGAKADNTSTNILTATVEDANGNRVPNAVVDWGVTTGVATLSSVTSSTDVNGQAIITVKDTTAETATITAKVDSNTADGGQTVDTTFSLYPVVSGITQGGDGSPADDTTANTLVIQVSDLANNPLVNQEVTLSLSGTNLGTGPATLKYGTTVLTAADNLTATTDGNGQLLLEATDITAESITVSAAVNNGSAAQTQGSVFGVYPVLSAADISVPLDEAPSDAVSLNTAQVIVRDLKGSPVSGQMVNWTLSSPSGRALFSPAGTVTATSTSDTSGIATISLTSRRMESVTVTAKAGSGLPAQTQSKATTFLQYANLTITGVTNNNCFVTCTVTVNVNAKDIDGNNLAGLKLATYGGNNLGEQVDGVSVVASDTNGNSAVTRTYVTATSDPGVYAVARSIENPGVISSSRSGVTGKSSEYISATTPVTTVNPVSITNITTPADPYTFTTGSGFPQTGFNGAYFKVNLSDGNPTAYTWAVDGNNGGTNYTTVDANGQVTLKAAKSGSQVVQVKNKATGTVLATYAFTISGWFTNNGTASYTWANANSYCSSQGVLLATTQQLVGSSKVSGMRGAVGGLWSEWGYMSRYPGGGFYGSIYWASEPNSTGEHYFASLDGGLVNYSSDGTPNYAACRKGL